MKIGRYNIGLKINKSPKSMPKPDMDEIDFVADPRGQAVLEAAYEKHFDEMAWRRERRWADLTDPSNVKVFTDAQRVNMVKSSRLHYVHDPLYGRSVDVTSDFVLGSGSPPPKLNVENPVLQESLGSMISEFWSNPWNRLALTSSQSQYNRFAKWQVDGELALILQKHEGGFTVAAIDPLDITQVVTHQSIPDVPMLFKRQVGSRVEWYWSRWAGLDEDEKARLIAKMEDQWRLQGNAPPEAEWIFLYKIGIDPIRGAPPYWSGIPWSDSVNDLASALRRYIFAMTKWTWENRVKGTQGDINRQVEALNQETVTRRMYSPFQALPAVKVSSSTESMSPYSISASGGQLFQHGFELCRLMVCAATGVPVTYLMGDPSTGNLATAETMELPWRKRCEHWQMLWTSVFDNLFGFMALESGILVDTESFIELDLPDFDTRDAGTLLPAISRAVEAGIFPKDDAARVATWLLNAGDAETIAMKIAEMPIGGSGEKLDDALAKDPVGTLRRFQVVLGEMLRATAGGKK